MLFHVQFQVLDQFVELRLLGYQELGFVHRHIGRGILLSGGGFVYLYVLFYFAVF